jgi:hypothetical protein
MPFALPAAQPILRSLWWYIQRSKVLQFKRKMRQFFRDTKNTVIRRSQDHRITCFSKTRYLSLVQNSKSQHFLKRHVIPVFLPCSNHSTFQKHVISVFSKSQNNSTFSKNRLSLYSRHVQITALFKNTLSQSCPKLKITALSKKHVIPVFLPCSNHCTFQKHVISVFSKTQNHSTSYKNTLSLYSCHVEITALFEKRYLSLLQNSKLQHFLKKTRYPCILVMLKSQHFSKTRYLSLLQNSK